MASPNRPQIWLSGLVNYSNLPVDCAVVNCLGLGSLGVFAVGIFLIKSRGYFPGN